MSVEDRALDYYQQMRSDMAKTLRQHLGDHFYITGSLLDDLVADGMFHVEHLLIAVACAEQRSIVDV